MVAEYWRLGEDVQDALRGAGYEPGEVEGIAVDLHDLLQAADRVEQTLAPSVAEHADSARIGELMDELEHVRWHCEAALATLQDARDQILGQQG